MMNIDLKRLAISVVVGSLWTFISAMAYFALLSPLAPLFGLTIGLPQLAGLIPFLLFKLVYRDDFPYSDEIFLYLLPGIFAITFVYLTFPLITKLLSSKTGKIIASIVLILIVVGVIFYGWLYNLSVKTTKEGICENLVAKQEETSDLITFRNALSVAYQEAGARYKNGFVIENINAQVVFKKGDYLSEEWFAGIREQAGNETFNHPIRKGVFCEYESGLIMDPSQLQRVIVTSDDKLADLNIIDLTKAADIAKSYLPADPSAELKDVSLHGTNLDQRLRWTLEYGFNDRPRVSIVLDAQTGEFIKSD